MPATWVSVKQAQEKADAILHCRDARLGAWIPLAFWCRWDARTDGLTAVDVMVDALQQKPELLAPSSQALYTCAVVARSRSVVVVRLYFHSISTSSGLCRESARLTI